MASSVHFSKLTVFCGFYLFLNLLGSFSTAQTIAFDQSLLDFNNLEGIVSGTSLQFGPDGRLYAVQLDGEVKIFTIEKPSPNTYQVQSVEILQGVKAIPNNDDNGNPAFDQRTKRQSTGIFVTGIASNPVVYVSSSDPKWGGPSGDTALDTNSGIITRLSWNGTSWDVIDLVRGLPRSEENHSTNGMQLVTINAKPYLLVASGGFTNAGSPSKNFAYISEYALSGAILSLDLNALNALPTKVDQRSGRSFKYDLPTLDDPSRANINNVYDPNDPGYDGIDVNDPFGGNDGLNMAMLVPGGPVQIFSAGYRNAYDLVVTKNGKVYVTDNGANGNWGGLPENEGNAQLVNNNYRDSEPGASSISPDTDGEYVDNKDRLLMVTANVGEYQFGAFYGGHPTPLRANPGVPYEKGHPFPFNPAGAGLYTKFIGDNMNWTNINAAFTPTDTFRTQILEPIAPGQPGFDNYAATSLPANWPPVHASLANPAEADFIAPSLSNPDGPQLQVVTVWPNNTNGLAEYTASNFGGVLKGSLIAGKSGGTLHYLEMNADGSLKSMEIDKWNLNGGNPLGISCNDDSDPFPGTIWVSTFDNRILVLTPADDVFCIAPDDPSYDPDADYDHDGYTNQDEVDNGTDPCSGASRPNDYDNDGVSDLNDLDDDGDGIPDAVDPFQLGGPVNLPVENQLFSNQLDEQGRQSGYLGLGLTGLMNNGAPNPNWLNWLDKTDEGPAPNDVYGGTAGAIQVAMAGGSAIGSQNNQEKGLQFGVNVNTETGSFTIRSGLMSLASPGQLYQYAGDGEVGIQMGDGTQSNFIKLVLTKSHVVAAMEVNDAAVGAPLMVPIPLDKRPDNAELVELSFLVNAVTGEVEAAYKIGDDPVATVGIIEATGKILAAIQQEDVPLAIGIFGTSKNPSEEFIASWDYFKVVGEVPYIIRPLTDMERIMGDADRVINLNEYFGDNDGIEALTYSVSENTNSEIGAIISGDSLTIKFPLDAVSTTITIRATDAKGLYVDQTFNVTVVEADVILLRINAGGPGLAGSTGQPNWASNSVTGAYKALEFNVTSGSVSSGYVYDPKMRHASIPSYIDDLTYTQLFFSERYVAQPTMAYNIPLPNGEYRVNLYMGNGFDGTSQALDRYFDIHIEDNLVVSNLDLSGNYGHRVGIMQQYVAKVSDGVLDIAFNKKTENPLVNGIEIIGKPIQTPIQFIPFKNQFNKVNEDINSSLVVMASGGDGNLNFAASGLPPGILIEPTNGTLHGVVAENALGSSPYLVTITIDDDDQIHSDAVSFNFSWTITPPETEMVWSEKEEDLNYTARHESSSVQAGNKFYLMGGRENSQTIEIYDYTSNTWTSLNNSAPEAFNHFQAAEYGGLIWVIGAFKTNNFPSEEPADYIHIFDPAKEEWIKGPEIPASRRRGAAGLVVYNDKFYLVGGNTIGHNGGYVAWFDEYDPATGTWTILEDAPRARDHFFATVVGNKLFAASGRLSGGAGGTFGPVIPQVDVYNFTAKTWSTLPSTQNLPTPRAAAVVANYNNKIIVAGGEVPNNSLALSVVEMYNPVLQTWSTLSSMNHARHGTQGIVSGGGLYVFGGSPVRGGGNQKNMEFFGYDDPQGTAIIASKIAGDSEVNVKKGKMSSIKISNIEGNQGIYIRDISIAGAKPFDFKIVAGKITNGLIKTNTEHEVLVEYVGSSITSSAILKIEYGKASVKEVQMVADGVFEPTTLFLNTGSSSDVSFNGETYVGDAKFASYYGVSGTYSLTNANGGPLYSTERNGKNLNYAIPLPNGTYTVQTHHTELWFGLNGPSAMVGRRVFDISMEGSLVKDNFDIFVENSNQPIVLTFENIVVSDGVLNINMSASQNNSTISGITITGVGEPVEAPVAKITASAIQGHAPLAVDFTGSGSTGGVAYLWSFGDGTTATSANASHTFSEPGDYQVTLRVQAASGAFSTASVTVTAFAEEVPADVSLFLNTGTSADVSFGGQTYLGDGKFPSYYGSSATYSNSSAPGGLLYTTERSGNILNYSIPLPNGTYTVRTHHTELWFGLKGPSAAAGRRVFDISMEGSLVKDNFDIFVENSNQPIVLTFENIAVSDGVLNINMSASQNNSTISGISITGSGSSVEMPVAKVSASILKGTAPLTVDFTGSGSTGGVAYLWSFGDGTTATSANASHTFSEPGDYQVTLRVQAASGAFSTASVTVTALAEEIPADVSLFLNTGTSADVSFGGQTYLGDGKFSSYYGTSATYSNSSAPGGLLYTTERSGNILNYSIPLPNGTYTVRTHHTELWFGLKGPSAAAGRRVFDISMEGSLVKDNFDIFVENSNQPIVLTFENIVVSDGVLNINMSALQNNSTISGISISGTSSQTINSANFRKNETSDVFSVEETKEESNKEWEITLYPNPAQTQTSLFVNREVNLKSILIHDMGGQLIRQFDPEVIKEHNGNYYLRLTDVPQGVYLVSLLSQNDMIKQLRLVVKP